MCNICCKKFKNSRSLTKHKAAHNKIDVDIPTVIETKRCRSARRTYLSLNFSSSRPFTENKKAHVCIYCEKRFYFKNALTLHYKMHLK